MQMEKFREKTHAANLFLEPDKNAMLLKLCQGSKQPNGKRQTDKPGKFN